MIKLVEGCNLMSTAGQAELHKFAGKLGLDRKFHIEPRSPRLSGFYLLRTKKLQRKALSLGAVEDPDRICTNLCQTPDVL
ncbi:hypothetical protein ES703_46235 [subsurface metagenome]